MHYDVCLLIDQINMFKPNNPIKILWICFAAKMIFEIYNAYNIMIMSQVMRKTTICMCENEGEDQPRGNREADQRLCFLFTDSTLLLLPKYKMYKR